ncbi:MAG: GIY-YIG nuclease family protein [Nitrincola lacisaponensis]|uniref:Putative endonuclease containing a URI domain n=1 Tax=Nitrincola lacisaponensis TaxID=267850 RepID=A0A063XWT6_9GAMM|nr:GIY-YIG nuclease family protein [Nitrincola lacisaponensis]KDE38673.1 putative endonuclease containing a URI domain [Nitrincola lacisaponensis]
MNEWYVYMLRCADQSLYTGITTDLQRRLDQHNNCDRLGARYTRGRRPVTLVWQESHPDRSSALKREAALKKLSRCAKERLLLSD